MALLDRPPWLHRHAGLCTALGLLALGACGGTPDDPYELMDAGVAPPACAPDPPSYATQVQPILAASCTTCHHPDSTVARSSLTSYASVHLVFGAALGQVESGLMPPASVAPLSEADRATLLAWLVCGAPDN